MSDVANIFKAPKALPAAAPVVALPDMEDPVIKAAGARATEEERRRAGRASTNLGGGSGAPVTYNNSTLGS